MAYVKPVDVASAMVETGRRKLGLSPTDLLIRGALAGSILAAATSLAGADQTDQAQQPHQNCARMGNVGARVEQPAKSPPPFRLMMRP